MKYRKELVLSAICFLMAFLCAVLWSRQQDSALAARVAPGILRFHIQAVSNSAADQKIKLEVRDFLLERLSACGAETKQQLLDYVDKEKGLLEQETETFLQSLGASCAVDIRTGSSRFPSKAYGDLVLPAGVYDAVQVRLEEGRGRNWWCVLYPRLCFADSLHAVLPEASKEQLRQLLTPEDYQALFSHPKDRLEIRFFFPQLLETLRAAYSAAR